MDTDRRLLFIGNEGDSAQQLSTSLIDRGWQLQSVDSWQKAKCIIKEKHWDVGLAHLDTACMPVPTEVDDLMDAGHTQWVALLEPDRLDDDRTRRLISSIFYAYHTLPGDPRALDAVLNHALAMARLAPKNNDKDFSEYEMVGSTHIMLELFAAIRKVAAVDAPVLIRGESGTGKELTARAIHERSPRRKGPFNAVNCAALPASLIQSELFGHEKGAFTGASQRKIGRIEATAGGTIFLDEIGDLPTDMQVNLLRFLEGRFIQRVGSHQEIPVDVRVVAATHVDLEKAIAEKNFREDLYHRLNVLQVKVPALRDRQDDIEVLARFFFEKFAAEKDVHVKGFSQQALMTMRQYSWPGNVRELINRVRRAMVMCENRLLRPHDLGLERRSTSRDIITLEMARDNTEKQILFAAMKRDNCNVTRAAKELGISRVTLYRLLEKHQLQHLIHHPAHPVSNRVN